MRAATILMIGALVAPGLAPTAALAQPRGDGIALEACARAVPRDVNNRYPQAYGVRLTNSTPQPYTRDEVRVVGKGEFEDRNGGAARFGFQCTYNYATNATYGIDVNDVRPIADPNDKKKDNSAAIAGLILGAIVVGAIAASSDKDDDRRDRGRDRDRGRRDNEWSPAPGVRCNSREASCYEDGRLSRKWTNRIFVR